MYNLYSDLHLDISMCKVESPCLIAGDIDGMPEIIGDISQVYSIKGNHDFWDGRQDKATPGRELINEAVKLPDGRTLFGGTMWTDMAWPASLDYLPEFPYACDKETINKLVDNIRQLGQGFKACQQVLRSHNSYGRMPTYDFDTAMSTALRFMNDYRYGAQPNTKEAIPLNIYWTISQHKVFFEKLTQACVNRIGDYEFQDDNGRPTAIAGETITNHMVVMSHHCPVSRELLLRKHERHHYDEHPSIRPAYYSPIIARLLMVDADFRKSVRDHGMTWVYGHTHEAVDFTIKPFLNTDRDHYDFYNHSAMTDTYEGAMCLEQEWEMALNTNAEYVDTPGVIRVVSNPRGYSRGINCNDKGKPYKGVKV